MFNYYSFDSNVINIFYMEKENRPKVGVGVFVVKDNKVLMTI